MESSTQAIWLSERVMSIRQRTLTLMQKMDRFERYDYGLITLFSSTGFAALAENCKAKLKNELITELRDLHLDFKQEFINFVEECASFFGKISDIRGKVMKWRNYNELETIERMYSRIFNGDDLVDPDAPRNNEIILQALSKAYFDHKRAKPRRTLQLCLHESLRIIDSLLDNFLIHTTKMIVVISNISYKKSMIMKRKLEHWGLRELDVRFVSKIDLVDFVMINFEFFEKTNTDYIKVIST
jgi:hypothetical protein